MDGLTDRRFITYNVRQSNKGRNARQLNGPTRNCEALKHFDSRFLRAPPARLLSVGLTQTVEVKKKRYDIGGTRVPIGSIQIDLDEIVRSIAAMIEMNFGRRKQLIAQKRDTTDGKNG